MNATVYKRVPGAVTIAEESTSWPAVTGPTSEGGLGFGFKWNMGWMHDSLGYVEKDPLYRNHHHGQMTFSLVYAFTENYVLPISHDEVVHGKGSLLRKMPGDRWQQLANLRAHLADIRAHPGEQLLFMGSEFGQESEWAEARELDWWLLEHPEHAGVHAMVRDLNHVLHLVRVRCGAGTTRPRASSGSTPTTRTATSSRSSGTPPVSRTSCAWPTSRRFRTRAAGLPSRPPGMGGDPGHRRCGVLGSGVGNLGRVTAVAGETNGRPAYAEIVVPPLATVWFRHEG